MKIIKALIILAPLGLIVWNNYYPTWLMQGTYVSNNTHPILEGPSGIDTLILNADGSFNSSTWVKGKWKIDQGNWEATYQYTYGTAGFSSSIYRPFFLGTPRINLNRDLKFYYRKIN